MNQTAVSHLYIILRGECMNVKTVVAIAVLVSSVTMLETPSSSAREVLGVTFPETITVEGKTLNLVGVGVRKKLFINVYLAGLYLEKPTKNPAEVISSDQVKVIEMRFIYKEVSAIQLLDAWNEGFVNNSSAVLDKIRSDITQFNGYFNEPMMKGDIVTFTYTPGQGTEVKIKGKVKGGIEGAPFMKALFSIWMGPKPPSDGLKEGMLGLK